MAPRQLLCDQSAIQRKRNPSTGERIPDFLKLGETLHDVTKKKWKIGKSIGMGAFGVVYLESSLHQMEENESLTNHRSTKFASEESTKFVGNDAKYVVKMEPHSSGPLFVEMNFYLRVAKEALINEWKTRRKLTSFGMPMIHGFGSHYHRRARMRFIALTKFGDSIEKMLEKHSFKFHIKTALTLAFHVVNVLEYVHSNGYVHLDLKGHNMVLGVEPDHAPVYLVDFGLATRYRNKDGTHKDASPDGRKAEAGTMLYSSRDAHKGIITRRNDLESLGYNLVTWFGGKLPWAHCLNFPNQVAERKEQAMTNVKVFLSEAFAPKPFPSVLGDFLTYVSKMDYYTDPEYSFFRRIFCQAIRDAGYVDDGKLTFDNHAKLTKQFAFKRKAERENLIGPKKKKPTYIPAVRNPCSLHNCNISTVRLTRNLDKGPKLRSKEFDWATVLAMHPDKIIKKDRNKNEVHSVASKFTVTVSKSDDLSNPTPAMIKVMQRSKVRSSEQFSKRSRFDSTSSSTGLTPAMEEVIANRVLCTRVLRSHSRRQNKPSSL